MSGGLRPPTVAGVGGGVATTTLAVGLRAHDAGRVDGAADILACRARPDSLRRAAAVLDRAGPGPRPVLAVTLDGGRAPRGARAHLARLAAAASAVVLLPDVGRWRTLDDPLLEVATLLTQPPDRLPRSLRCYAAALGELASAVTASGRLAPAPRPDPVPQRAGPRAAAPPVGAPPVVARPVVARPVGTRAAAAPLEPDRTTPPERRPTRGVRIVAVPRSRIERIEQVG